MTTRRVALACKLTSEPPLSRRKSVLFLIGPRYKLKKEIGRGSFGAVHLAVDQFGTKYAVKEFSKSRLRKRSQSVILRRPFAARQGGFLNARGHGRSASEIQREMEGGNPLHLIREEIAILKKLDHPNVVNLVEVLDDPEGDSLYMVLEMCEKGVVMKVDLQTTCEPYPEEQCRLWFRDMILGIEYCMHPAFLCDG